MKATPNTKKRLKVTDKVPVPPIEKSNSYPMLKIGESFFVPGKVQSQLSGVVHNRVRRYKQKHIMRTRVERGVKGLRVWRTA